LLSLTKHTVCHVLCIFASSYNELSDLIPTLLSLSTTRLSFPTLATSFQQVCIYVSKFRNRLGPGNMLHLKRLVVFLDALRKYVVEWKQARISQSTEGGNHGRGSSEIITVAELSERLGRKAAAVNLLEIAAYLKRSKVTGYRIYFSCQALSYLSS
jgi:chromosome transmission fidelity protein 1